MASRANDLSHNVTASTASAVLEDLASPVPPQAPPRGTGPRSPNRFPGQPRRPFIGSSGGPRAGSRRIALRAILAENIIHNASQSSPHRRRIIVKNRVQCIHLRLAPPRILAGQHFVENDPEREQVAALIE